MSGSGPEWSVIVEPAGGGVYRVTATDNNGWKVIFDDCQKEKRHGRDCITGKTRKIIFSRSDKS